MNPPSWYPIQGYEKLYQVCSDGRVASLGRRTVGGSRGGPCEKLYRPRVLRTYAGGARTSLRIGLRDEHGEVKKFQVARLVLTAFIGLPPTPKHVAHHLDWDWRNCRVDNLRWLSQSELSKLGWQAGRHPVTSGHRCADQDKIKIG